MPKSRSAEFALIDRYFSNLGVEDESVVHGVGDDCALVSPPPGKALSISIDTVVEGVHFPPGIKARHVASRALGSALSDLAASGASASHFTLALTLPDNDLVWLDDFASGLADMAEEYGVRLIGGDTCRGPLSVTIQVHGWVDKDSFVSRGGAQVGHGVYVSGYLGDAGAGLRLCMQGVTGQEGAPEAYLLGRFFKPSPRLMLGQVLSGRVSACIDLSDGLVADAQHIADHSEVALSINVDLLPVSTALKTLFPGRALELAASSGDDYELLFVCAEQDARQIETLMGNTVELTRIGDVQEGRGLTCLCGGKPIKFESGGYQHFV